MTKDKKINGETSDAPAAEQTAAPDLTVNDLLALKSIIDVASQRGAFKPAEMSTVGQTYEKLERFLKAIEDSQKSDQAETES